MSTRPGSDDDAGLLGARSWEVVASGSIVELRPVPSRLTPLQVSIAAVLLGVGIKLAGVALLWALVATAAVAGIGLIGLRVNQVEERQFRRIRFDGLRRLVEIGDEARPVDSFSSIGIDRVLTGTDNAPKAKTQRATLVLRPSSAASAVSMPLIRGILISEPKMEIACGLIATLTGLPVVHQREIYPSELRKMTLLAIVLCVPLVGAVVSGIVFVKQNLDRRHLKERAVFQQASVLSEQQYGRGPFRQLTIQLGDRTASIHTRRWEPFGPGEKVTVFYDPDYPNQVEMDDSRHSLLMQTFLLVLYVGFAAMISFLVTRMIQMIRIGRRT